MRKSVLKNLLLTVLLIINGILLFMWWNAPERQHHGPRNKIIEKLDFNDQQIAKYDAYIREHRKQIRSLEKQLAAKKKQLFGNIDTPFSDSLANEIAGIEKKILVVHYNHFKEIESLCKGGQKEKFNLLSKEIAELFDPKRKKHD